MTPDRLDAFLAGEGRMISRVKAKKAVEEGRVCLNDLQVTKSSLRLQEGDKVTLIEEKEVKPASIEATDLHLTILFEDDACFVIQKPAGIAVHPGAGMEPGEKTVLHGAAWLFQERGIPFSEEGVLVHRLDRPTTGCLLIAKNPAAHVLLQKQFEERTVSKTYLALVAGVPVPASAVIDAPIGRSSADRTKMTVLGSASPRASQTTYRTLAATNRAALLSCELHTGRTHQIRVHLSTIGHPVLGDDTYVSALSERIAADFSIPSLCLHAWKLCFRSPADDRELEMIAPIPPSFLEAVKRVGLSWSA